MGYYELWPKLNKVIRHFVRGNDGFASHKPSNWERKSLCNSLLLWSFRRFFIFNSIATDQGNTLPPFSQLILCCLQLELHCDIWWCHVHWIPSCHENLSIVTRHSFSPSPCTAKIWPARLSGDLTDRAPRNHIPDEPLATRLSWYRLVRCHFQIHSTWEIYVPICFGTWAVD